MKTTIDKGSVSKTPWIVIAIVLLVVISAIITVAVRQSPSGESQDTPAPEVRFCGEYRIKDGEWLPLTGDSHISATRGNVELKGEFRLYDAATQKELGAAPAGTVLHLYLDHVRVTVKDSLGNVWSSDNENRQLGVDTCAETWDRYEIGADGEVTLTIYNPHSFGNEKSVDSFLNNLQVYDESNTLSLSDTGKIQIGIGFVLLIFFFVLIGASLVSSVLRVKYTREMWLALLLVLFGGIYFIFSSERIGIWSEAYAVNTVILGFSMMLYLLVATMMVASFLYGNVRRIAIASTVVLGTATVISAIAAIMGTVRFYDVYLYWVPVAVVVSVCFIVCIVKSFVRSGKSGEPSATEGERKYVYIPSLVVFASVVIDVALTCLGIWQGAVLSVAVYLFMVLVAIVIIARVVPTSIKTVIEAKNLEAEKQAMELKLQESHISIMLSQIQPHFLYNTLNSIYQLCETNPLRARSMVNSFSEYLRNNLSTLEEPGLISFETELSHVNTYLDIEKMRFEDTLEIEYDIQCKDFYLPVLTVQPIVENAVKHGTSKKRGGGRIIISTQEERDGYVISVSDTGCGFDPTKPKNDGKRHIGIENVRQRLSNMCHGTLTIESKVGEGTLATIRIPKGGRDENNSRR